MFSSGLLMAVLFTMGGLGVVSPVSNARKTGIVAIMAIYNFGFGAGWGPLPYVLSTEIPALRLRDYTSRIGFGVNVLMK